jgi:uncharacterized membrane protein
MAIFSSFMSWFGVFGSMAAGSFYNGTSFALGGLILLVTLFACGMRKLLP